MARCIVEKIEGKYQMDEIFLWQENLGTIKTCLTIMYIRVLFSTTKVQQACSHKSRLLVVVVVCAIDFIKECKMSWNQQ